MTLRDLRAEFLKVLTPTSWRCADVPMGEADGLWFLCPLCFHRNGGRMGTHSVVCWAPHVPQTVNPIPGRWSMTGTSLDDLTLVAGSDSIKITSGCMAHFFVRRGQIEFCDDCPVH